jgi:protein ECT2
MSRASARSGETISQCTVTPCQPESPPRRPRSLSRNRSERQPRGPRSPSPLPLQSPVEVPSTIERPPSPPSKPPSLFSSESQTRSGIPRSKRQPLHPTGNIVQAAVASIPKTSSIEPLTIKKKTSVRASDTDATPVPTRRASRQSRLASSNSTSLANSSGKTKTSLPTRAEPMPVPSAQPSLNSSLAPIRSIDEGLIRLSQTTKRDVRFLRSSYIIFAHCHSDRVFIQDYKANQARNSGSAA